METYFSWIGIYGWQLLWTLLFHWSFNLFCFLSPPLTSFCLLLIYLNGSMKKDLRKYLISPTSLQVSLPIWIRFVEGKFYLYRFNLLYNSLYLKFQCVSGFINCGISQPMCETNNESNKIHPYLRKTAQRRNKWKAEAMKALNFPNL